jgi:hypothetical protein
MRSSLATSKTTASFEEITFSNMFVMEALVEQLGEKGLIDRERLTKRVRELTRETRLVPALTPIEQAIAVSATEAMLTSSHFVLDLLMDLLFDKGFLSLNEIDDLKTKLSKRVKLLLRNH